MEQPWYHEESYHYYGRPPAGASDRKTVPSKKSGKSVATKSGNGSGSGNSGKLADTQVEAKSDKKKEVAKKKEKEKEKERDKKQTDSSRKRSKDDPTTKLVASAYFLEWQQTSFQSYVRKINDLFLKPLVKHVTGNRLQDDGTIDYSCKERERLKAGPQEEEQSDQHQLRMRLKEATMRNWDNDGLHSSAGEQMTTLGEMAVMHRLRSLVQISGQLLTIEARLNKWLEKHIGTIAPHAASLSLLPYASYAFEATSALSEIFHLRPIDRAKCRIPTKGTAYVRELEAQINGYRACVYVIGSCLTASIHSLFKVVPHERLEVRPREVEDTLLLLPNPFLDPAPLPALSAYTLDLLNDAPPSNRKWPKLPKGTEMSSGRREPEPQSDTSVEEGETERTENHPEPSNREPQGAAAEAVTPEAGSASSKRAPKEPTPAVPSATTAPKKAQNQRPAKRSTGDKLKDKLKLIRLKH
ncbi:unnamed protein product, partial [Mesorhabditis spiculigera]